MDDHFSPIRSNKYREDLRSIKDFENVSRHILKTTENIIVEVNVAYGNIIFRKQ